MTDIEKKATAQDVIDTLRSIDAGIKLLIEHFGCLTPRNIQSAPDGRSVPRVASDSDLDSQYGDPVIRMKDPRDWTGDSMMGLPFSECPPEYLDLWAERNDYFGKIADEEGTKANNGKPLSYYKYKDAARARGWAARKRNGWQPQPAEEAAAFPSDAPMVADDDIPF